ncbi:MAG TPA: ATP-binding protein [Candidatus Dormibacteraeota bacterium]
MTDFARRVLRFCGYAHTSTRFFRAVAIGFALVAIAYEVCIAFNLGGAWFATAVDDIGSGVAALLAAVACGVAACLTRRATRFGWALLAVSALAWAAGETYWSYIEVGLGLTVPSPSWADVGYLLSVPFGFAGVLVFAISASRRTEGLRALVDGLLIASSLLLVSWEAILRVTYADSSQSVVGKLVNLSYPVSDVALLTIAVIALTRFSRAGRTPIALLCAGIIGIAISDSAFTYLTAATNYTGTALDGGWLDGYLLIALASLRSKNMGAAAGDGRLSGRLRLAAPYAALLLAVATAVVVVVGGGGLDPIAVLIGAGIATLGIGSQFLVILENQALLRQSRGNEHALIESRRSLEQVIDNAPVALFSIDLAGILTLATGNALTGFGDRATHLVGRNFRDVLRDSPEFLAAVENALLERPGQLIVAFEHGDLDVRLLPVHEEGRIVSVSGVAIDVTERRLAEQMRRESDAKSRFLATMSHELRTPLNSVLGFAELLLGQRRGDLNESQVRYVNNIAASGKHLLALINDVLDLSRVASGEMEVVIRRVSLEEAIAEAVTKIRPLADRKRLTLVVEDGGAADALADPVRLQQIVLNLLSNAVKFTPPGGQITVRSRSGGIVVELEVSDTGIGIPAEHLGRIFEEYAQVDDAYSRDQEGTGLGLAVSRRLAELMSATITVESVVGRGSVFRLRLPAAPVVPPEDAAGGREGDDGPGAEPEQVAAKAAQA